MTAMHRELAAGRWVELPLVGQMADIGSEIERTIADLPHRRRPRELVRVREALAEFFVFENRGPSPTLPCDGGRR